MEIKATADHLTNAGDRLFWDNTSDADHAAVLFKMTVNDPTEIYFGAMTGQLRSYGKIVLTNAGGVIQIIVNGNLSRRFDTSWGKEYQKSEGNIP